MTVGRCVEIGRWRIYVSLWLQRNWALNVYGVDRAWLDLRYRSGGVACGPLDVFALVQVRR